MRSHYVDNHMSNINVLIIPVVLRPRSYLQQYKLNHMMTIENNIRILFDNISYYCTNLFSYSSERNYVTEYLPKEAAGPSLNVSSSSALWISIRACFTCISDGPSISRYNLRSPAGGFLPGGTKVPRLMTVVPVLSVISSIDCRWVTLRRA